MYTAAVLPTLLTAAQAAAAAAAAVNAADADLLHPSQQSSRALA
jgi:hypothetical protein